MEDRGHFSLSPNWIRGAAFCILLVLSIFAGRLVVEGHPQAAPVIPKTEPTLTGSFSDLFSGTAWIDEVKTTLYRDNEAGAFLFPPQFVWNPVEDNRMLAELGNDIGQNPNERACLGERCLVVRGKKMYWEEGQKSVVVLYPGSSDVGVVRLAVAPLSSGWLVGVTRSGEKNFSARIFRFDGTIFENIFSDGRDAFLSPRDGYLGMGGSDNEWLALWSGYEGQALRVRFGGAPENLSSFFGIRLMHDGFLPYVARVATRNSVDWYVWGIGDGAPRLLKMFEMLDGTVGGVIDFTPLLFNESVLKIIPHAIVSGTTLADFLVRIDHTGGASEWKELRDDGFRSDGTGMVVSKNIKTTQGTTRAAALSPLRLFEGGGAVRFEFSVDGIQWTPFVSGTETQFTGSGRELYWRAQFKPGENPRLSPFFEGIHVDFREST